MIRAVTLREVPTKPEYEARTWGFAFGRVAEVEKRRDNAASARLRLDSGSRVGLSPDLAQRLFAEYTPAHTLYFVDQGFFGKVIWLGTAKELREAVHAGRLSAKALGRFRVPESTTPQPGWETDMENPFRHDDVGEKLPEFRALLGRYGQAKFAASLSLDLRLEHMQSKDASPTGCMAGT